MKTLQILNFHPIFSENAICLANRYNIKLENDFIPKEDNVYIVFGGHIKSPDLCNVQKKFKNIKFIIMNSENYKSDIFRNKFYLKLLNDNVVFDYDNINTKKLKIMDINIHSQFVFEFIKPTMDEIQKERDIDYFFCGSRNDRREKLLSDLVKKYPDKKIICDFDYKFTDWRILSKSLLRTKYVINISYYSNGVKEHHRINKAMRCGCKIINVNDNENEINVDKFYERSYDELIHTCSYDIFHHNKFIINQLL